MAYFRRCSWPQLEEVQNAGWEHESSFCNVLKLEQHQDSTLTIGSLLVQPRVPRTGDEAGDEDFTFSTEERDPHKLGSSLESRPVARAVWSRNMQCPRRVHAFDESRSPRVPAYRRSYSHACSNGVNWQSRNKPMSGWQRSVLVSIVQRFMRRDSGGILSASLRPHLM